MANTFQWREGRPNPIRTSAGSVAKVRHAVPVVLDHNDKQVPNMRALCGVRAAHGWQRTSATLPACVKCADAIKVRSYTEAKP